MGYTYDARQDFEGFESLTAAQRELGARINESARDVGTDRHALLVAADAPAEDKAALADIWGGPGAGEEFVR